MSHQMNLYAYVCLCFMYANKLFEMAAYNGITNRDTLFRVIVLSGTSPCLFFSLL